MLTQRRWALALALTASAAACGDGSSVVGGPPQDATVSNDLGPDTGFDSIGDFEGLTYTKNALYILRSEWRFYTEDGKFQSSKKYKWGTEVTE